MLFTYVSFLASIDDRIDRVERKEQLSISALLCKQVAFNYVVLFYIEKCDPIGIN